jgi:hypothetical protein
MGWKLGGQSRTSGDTPDPNGRAPSPCQGEGRGLMTSKKCAAPMMCEALGREDILEEGCHMTCPASIEETAELYNPNMKMDVLAIPLGWTLTMCVAAGS